MISHHWLGRMLFREVLLNVAFLIVVLPFSASADLARDFVRPPDSARPWTYWFWINGNISKEGITADLEAMQRVGIGGVLIMEVANPKIMAPEGPVPFAGPEWRALFQHVVAESRRLGLQVSMNNDAGWCGSGGPWIPPEYSMQKLVATKLIVTGARRVQVRLPRPEALHNYYRDVRVLAYPQSEKAPISPTKILDLTGQMDGDGNLLCDLPAGEWKILRVGVTTTGAMNKPAPESGRGLECDKFSPDAIEHHFENFIGKLVADNRREAGRTFTMTHIDSWEVGDQDWTANMTREFRKRRGYDLLPWLPVLAHREIVGSAEQTKRFLWDFTRTKAELNVEAYAVALRKISNRHKLKLSIEAYNGKGFLNPLTYGAAADLPMAEFWINRWGAWHLLSPRLMASVGHVHNRPIIGAESFTSWPEADTFSEHPYSVKATGDWAFTEGINRFVFHRTVMDPWTNHVPGMSFGGFGWHVDRKQTWLEPGAAFMQYVARCQVLLQAGQFVADICRLVPVGEDYGGHVPGMRTLPDQYDSISTGYNYDYISDQALLEEVRVRNGRIVTRSGMSYRVLQLPNQRTLAPALAHKLHDLVKAGAVVVGPRPEASPSLENYPECDRQVQRWAAKIWGRCDGHKIRENQFGKGKAFWGVPLQEVLEKAGAIQDFTFAVNPPLEEQAIVSITHGRGSPRPNEPAVVMPTAGLNWIHRRDRNTDFFFVANPQHRAVEALCTFRVEGKQPELWDPATGEIREALISRNTPQGVCVPLHFDPAGSTFVVFRRAIQPSRQVVKVQRNGRPLFEGEVNTPEALPQLTSNGKKGGLMVQGTPGNYEFHFADGHRKVAKIDAGFEPIGINSPWTVRFQPGRGAPDTARFNRLLDWSRHTDEGIRYFSGTAVYQAQFEWNGSITGQRCFLDLGDVQVMADVTLNDKPLGVFWKPPFRMDATQALKPGINKLEVKVTNLWPNRLIGDEQFPDDCTSDGRWKLRALPAWPKWFLENKPRPEPRRVTFTTWKYFAKDSPLLPSGLIGPVRLVGEPVTEIQ